MKLLILCVIAYVALEVAQGQSLELSDKVAVDETELEEEKEQAMAPPSDKKDIAGQQGKPGKPNKRGKNKKPGKQRKNKKNEKKQNKKKPNKAPEIMKPEIEDQEDDQQGYINNNIKPQKPNKNNKPNRGGKRPAPIVNKETEVLPN